MTTQRTRTSALAANAAGLATALAFISQEAEAAVEVLTPTPSPVMPGGFCSISFSPTSSAYCISFSLTDLLNVQACGFNVYANTLSCGSSFEALFVGSCTSTPPFSPGDTISACDLGSTFACVALPTDGSLYYLGFGYRALSSSDPYNMGWVEISQTSSFGTLAIHQWAYETVAGEDITAGVVPEPATTAVATGGLAIASYLAYKRFKSKHSS